MKPCLALLGLAFMLAACGTPAPRAPGWRDAANAALADYVKQRLEGHATAATRAYAMAQERMRDGGDLDGLHTVLLTHCAMDVALLLPADCSDFVQRNTGARAEALAYHALLSANLRPDQITALPERYRAFAGALGAGSGITRAVEAINDPISRMVATGVAGRAGRADEPLFAASGATARAQGWRAAHRTHEEARARVLDTLGRTSDAVAVRARLQALYGTAAP